MQAFITGILIIVSLGWLTACSTLDNAEPPAALTEIIQPEPLRKLWSFDSGAGIDEHHYDLEPLLLGDKVFTIDTRGVIHQVDVASGRSDWKYDTGLAAISGLEGNAANLVATSRDGEVALLKRRSDGLDLAWQTNLGSEIRSPATLDRDLVLVRSGDGKLHALNRNDGSPLWVVLRRVPALSLTGTSQPKVYRDLVIAGFDNGKLLALDRSSGSVEWEASVGIPRGRTEIERLVDLDGQFTIRDGIIYVSSFQGSMAAVMASSGQVIWSREFSSSRALTLDEEAIYVSDSSSHLWAIDRRTGSAFWKQDILSARRLTAPALIGQHLVVADLEGYAHWFNKSDGRLVGRIPVSDLRVMSRPLTSDNKVLVLDGGGELVAIARKRRQ